MRQQQLIASCLFTCVMTLLGCASNKAEPIAQQLNTPKQSSEFQQLPPLPQPEIQLAAYAETPTEASAKNTPIENVPRPLPELATSKTDNTYLVDLPTVLRLADADNIQVGIARLQIDQALARQQRAESLWLPSIRAGVNYNRHEGAIQDVVGQQFDTSRGAFYTGMGAGVFGAGAPMVPGLLAQFHLTDAYFQPLAARQATGARSHAAAAVKQNTLLQVSLAHLELQRAAQELAIVRFTEQQAAELAKLTADFAKAGQGAQADADRAAAEHAQRELDVCRAEELYQVNGARLAQLLRLDPTLQLVPAEPQVVPLEMVPQQASVRELTAIGLSQRPELAEQRHLVCEAVARLRREQMAPLIPSVMLGASYGGLGSGVDSNYAALQDRFDFDAVAYWELRNFGQGEQAARREAYALLRQQQLRQVDALDQVAREVVEAHAQVQARAKALAPAATGWRAAESSQKLNWERVRAGQALPLEALQSIVALNQAQRSYLRSIIEYNQAQLTLQRALGYPVDLVDYQTPVVKNE